MLLFTQTADLKMVRSNTHVFEPFNWTIRSYYFVVMAKLIFLQTVKRGYKTFRIQVNLFIRLKLVKKFINHSNIHFYPPRLLDVF